MLRLFLVTILFCAASAATLAQEPAAVVPPSPGKALRLANGEETGSSWVDGEYPGVLRFADELADSAIREVQDRDLVAWGQLREPTGSQLVLADGSVLRGGITELKNDAFTLESSVLGTVQVPLVWLRGALVQPPHDPQRRDELFIALVREADANAPREDRLRLDNDDLIRGELLQWNGELATLKSTLGDVDVETDRVVSLSLNPALVVPPRRVGPALLVGLSDGTRLLVERLSMKDNVAELTFCTTPKTEPWRAPVEQVVLLQPLGGRVSYLSDRESASYKHIPYLTMDWPFTQDANVAGGQLRAGGRLFAKGIGMHSAARLTYALPADAEAFEALISVDDGTAGRGSVGFRVYVDEELKFQQAGVHGGDLPQQIRVPVAGGKLLSLLIDFGEGADESDHADWLDARLILK